MNSATISTTRPVHSPGACGPAAVATALLLIASACALLAGCQPPTKRYPLQGRVITKSFDTQQITVDHQDIPGFMPAMTMPYVVKDTQGLTDVQPGDAVTADVVVHTPSDYWLEHLVITDKSGRGTVSATVPHELEAGEKVPDVTLTDENGKRLLLSQLHGKAVLVTFIYTRCPLPTFCPLISSEFAAIHKELAKTPAAKSKTHLVSITLDPTYDTPPVMRKYGLAYLQDNAAGFEDWDFVSTTPADLKKLATAFGLQYYEQENQIAHSMSTVLLGPDGTVAKTWPGNEWKTDEVLAAIRQTANLQE